MLIEKHSSAISTTARFAGVDSKAVRSVLVSNKQSRQGVRSGRHNTAIRTVARFAGIGVEQVIAGIKRQTLPRYTEHEVCIQDKAA
jgi:hypothetical protein